MNIRYLSYHSLSFRMKRSRMKNLFENRDSSYIGNRRFGVANDKKCAKALNND